MDGASDCERSSKIFGFFESWFICRMSVLVSGVWAIPPPTFEARRLILFARMSVLNRSQFKLIE